MKFELDERKSYYGWLISEVNDEVDTIVVDCNWNLAEFMVNALNSGRFTKEKLTERVRGKDTRIR